MRLSTKSIRSKVKFLHRRNSLQYDRLAKKNYQFYVSQSPFRHNGDFHIVVNRPKGNICSENVVTPYLNNMLGSVALQIYI